MTASLLEQLADLPKAEVDALIRAMAPDVRPPLPRLEGSVESRFGFDRSRSGVNSHIVEEISSWGIYETTRRKAEAVIRAREEAAAAARPKPEYAPGSLEYQALHPEWKPQEE